MRYDTAADAIAQGGTLGLNLWFSLLVGCSFSLVEEDSCETNSQCHDVFGLGSSCDAEGFCEIGEPHARCEMQYPDSVPFPIDGNEYFVIGTVFDHTSSTHVGRYRSAQLAVKQANESGGLDGKQFALINCTNQEDSELDNLTKDEATVETARWLAETVGVSVIIGPSASSRAQLVYTEIAEANDVLIVSPSATSVALTNLDGLTSTQSKPGLFWRTAPPDDLQAFAIAQDMVTEFASDSVELFRNAPSMNVAVVHQIGAYGEGLAASFAESHTKLGGTSVLFQFDGDSQRTDAIIDASSAGFDEILFASSDTSDVIAFLQTVETLDSLAETPLFLTDSSKNTDFLDGAPASTFERIRGTAPSAPAGVVFESFRGGYAAEYGGDDVALMSYTAHAFDATWLAIYGHAWALSNEPQLSGTPIARGFRKVSTGDPISIRATDWNTLTAKFKQGTPVDVEGASGTLDFDPESGETVAPIDVWIVGDGDFTVVSTFQP